MTSLLSYWHIQTTYERVGNYSRNVKMPAGRDAVLNRSISEKIEELKAKKSLLGKKTKKYFNCRFWFQKREVITCVSLFSRTCIFRRAQMNFRPNLIFNFKMVLPLSYVVTEYESTCFLLFIFLFNYFTFTRKKNIYYSLNEFFKSLCKSHGHNTSFFISASNKERKTKKIQKSHKYTHTRKKKKKKKKTLHITLNVIVT